MSIEKQQAQVKAYFNVWLSKNLKDLNDIFSKDVYYAECFGPEYRGLYQVELWIKTLFNQQSVISWDIHEMIASNDQKQMTVTWTFKAYENDKELLFDGLSLIKFDHEDRIIVLKEYEALHDKEIPSYIREGRNNGI